MAVRIKNIFFFFLPYILSPLINIEGGGGAYAVTIARLLT